MLLSQSRMYGTSHVLPPGYRNGLRCGTLATLMGLSAVYRTRFAWNEFEHKAVSLLPEAVLRRNIQPAGNVEEVVRDSLRHPNHGGSS